MPGQGDGEAEMSRLVIGIDLNAHQRALVLRCFGYRWTRENHDRARAWVGHTEPTVPLMTDEEWLESHAFHVTREGRLDRRYRHCEPSYMAAGGGHHVE
jgi:hypothetical protein